VKSKSGLTLSMTVLTIAAFTCAMMAQGNRSGGAQAGPPKFLNMVHEELKPGRNVAFDELATSIARTYNRENLQVFWLKLESLTGPSEVLYFSLFDSSEEMGKTMDALSGALAARPELAQMQERLLQENTANESTVLGVRRDDMGFRANTIDFSKMRILRLSTIFAHPGYERAFMEAEWSLSEASQKVNAQAAWVVYEVTAGLPGPCFIIVTPMGSLKDLDDQLQATEALQKAEGGAIEQHLQELARVAYGATDERLYAVGQKASHVSKEFAAGDPEFWTPATTSAPAPAAARTEKTPPKRTGAPATKP
jgi:hypothetical protein